MFDQFLFKPADEAVSGPHASQAFARILQAVPLPPDFCWRAYVVLNGDLWHFRTEEVAVTHYIEYGQAEERAWHRVFDPEFFRRLYMPENDRHSPAELEEIWRSSGERCFASLREVLWTTGFAKGLWPDAFDAQSYVVYNNLQASVRNEVQAVVHFLLVGIPQLLAISGEMTFDPAFRRALFGDRQDLADMELYRNWIETALSRNEPCNERYFLRNMGVLLPAIPEGFLWRRYLSDSPHLLGLAQTKWHAFEHFARYGVLERGPLPLTQDVAGEVLLALADRFVTIGQTADADRLYERIFMADDPLPRAWQHAGDNALRAGQHARAMNLYRRVAKEGEARYWTYCNFIGAALTVGDIDTAAEWLDEAIARYPRDQRMLSHHATHLRQAFDLAVQRHIARLKGAELSLDSCHAMMLEDISRIHARLLAKYARQFGEFAGPRRPPSPGRKLRVAILANQDLAQCTYYRVTLKREQLEAAGIEAEIFAREDAADFRQALGVADVAIFYRLACDPEMLDSLALCHYLRVPSIYEVDDLVFDSTQFPESLASYNGAITEEQHFGLRAGVALVDGFARLCGHGLVSTSHLAGHLGARVSSAKADILRNGLSWEMVSLAKASRPAIASDGRLRIFYGSGTHAHGEDFSSLLVPALKRLLDAHPKVTFVACGHVDVTELQRLFPMQVEKLPLMADRQAYHWHLRQATINLAILRPSPFNDCKSEIKWLEAAVFGLPSVVSDVGVYREVLTDGVDALLVPGTPDAWYEALSRLVGDDALRARLGTAARKLALRDYNPRAQGEVLKTVLSGLARGATKALIPALARTTLPTRVLVSNVFYPPQSIGGATRVVHDEVRALHGLDNFEIGVLCGNDDPGPNHVMEAYWEHGVPVWSINTPQRQYMDWWPDDPGVRPAVERVLSYFEPDLVHFHATQRLTLSAVEAVRAHGVPYIVTLHDAWWISDHQFLMNGRDYLTWPWEAETFGTDANPHSRESSSTRRMRLLAALAGARQCIAVSESFAEIYRRAGVTNVVALPNPLSPLPPLQPTPTATGKVRLGHIGGMTYHKGFFLLKQALMRGHYDRLEVVVVDHAAKAGDRQRERWGATDVTLIGKVGQDHAGWLYGQFDVLTAPSTWPESFGLVTREAAVYGKWVIASDRGAIGEVVIEGINGFKVDVSDLDGLQRVLGILQADPDRYARPPGTHPPLFSLDDHVKGLTAIYREALGPGKRRPS